MCKRTFALLKLIKKHGLMNKEGQRWDDDYIWEWDAFFFSRKWAMLLMMHKWKRHDDICMNETIILPKSL